MEKVFQLENQQHRGGKKYVTGYIRCTSIAAATEGRRLLDGQPFGDVKDVKNLKVSYAVS